MDRCRRLLEADGIDVPVWAEDRLRRYMDLLTEWNRVVSLVSAGDLGRLDEHVADSLSLAGQIRRLCAGGQTLVDIGSGGGFPAIPLKIVRPDLPVVMLERSERKVGFLRKAVAVLGLESVELVCGEFPSAAPVGRAVGAVTSRAVEKPEKFGSKVLAWLPEGASWLEQSGKVAVDEGRFHVEHIRDAWSDVGIRRGELRLISRR